MAKNPLIARLEEQRFQNAIDYVRANANGLKKLSTTELAQLNHLLTNAGNDPWRRADTSVTIPSGKTHQFQILSNPVHQARDILSPALDMAGNGDFKEGAFHIYSQLVQAHLFNDANRRTAALACLWVVCSQGKDLDVVSLVAGGLGDVREAADLQALKTRMSLLIK